MTSNIPILGFSAYSGTGKTTLLRQIIPALKQRGLRVSVIKHAHHDFDLDFPGKDSYELRKSGADQTVISTMSRMATITEFATPMNRICNKSSPPSTVRGRTSCSLRATRTSVSPR